MPVRGASRSATNDTKESALRARDGTREGGIRPPFQAIRRIDAVTEDQGPQGARGRRDKTPRDGESGRAGSPRQRLAVGLVVGTGLYATLFGGAAVAQAPAPADTAGRLAAVVRACAGRTPMKLTSSALARRPGVPTRRRTPAQPDPARPDPAGRDGSSPAYRPWSGGSDSGQPRGSGSRRRLRRPTSRRPRRRPRTPPPVTLRRTTTPPRRRDRRPRTTAPAVASRTGRPKSHAAQGRAHRAGEARARFACYRHSGRARRSGRAGRRRPRRQPAVVAARPARAR